MLPTLRYAARSLRKTPTLTLAVVLTLALCIGATTAIFSVVYSVLFRPLPFAEPGGILVVRERWNGMPGSMSAGNWWDARRADELFQHLVPIQHASVNLAGTEIPENVVAARVGADFFGLLGVSPALGRVFLPEEDHPGADGVVVLSDGLWRRRFGADPTVIGRDVRIDGLPRRVIGVMPRSLDYTLNDEELWLPIAFTPERLAQHDEHYLLVLGRLKPGVTLAAARSSLAGIGRRLAEQFPKEDAGRGLEAVPLMDELVRDYRPRLLVLFGAAAFVLLIACANIANLLLARATARSRETAIRAAIGAGRWHILRQALAESVLLAAAGGVLGVALAYWGVAGLVAVGPADVPRLASARVDAPVLGFALLVTLLCGLVSGLAPALRMAAQFPHEALKESGRTVGGGRRDRLRGVLVVAEIALALVLLTGAGLMIRSAVALNDVDPGFDPRGVTTAHVSLPAVGYETPGAIEQAFARIAERQEQTPGAAAAGLVSAAPFEGGGNNGLVPEGRPLDLSSAVQSDLRLVTTGYFQAMGIRLRRGRLFGTDDRADAPLVMVINETLARKAWPGEDPIGKRIACCEEGPNGGPKWKTVVGVVGDVRAHGVGEAVTPEFYLPVAQAPAAAWQWVDRTMTLAIRSSGDAAAVAAAMREAVWSMDRTLPVYAIETMDGRRADSLASSRFSTMLLTAFGSLALVLAAIGVYGVISYGVSQRTQEIGIRVALGAGNSNVLGLIVGHAAALTGAGLLLGLTGALALSRVIAGLLFQVSPTDPPTLGGGIALLSIVALLAAALPARRAARIDPAVALRAE